MKLLSPKKFKYKKLHNIFYKSKCFLKLKFITTYTQLLIYSVNTGYLTAKHLETFRLFLRRIFKTSTNLKIFIDTFPDLSLTKKSAGLRMGKGKGKPYVWVSKLKKGAPLFKIVNFVNNINWETEYFNIPTEYENYFNNKLLRSELPFTDRIDILTSYSEAFRIPFLLKDVFRTTLTYEEALSLTKSNKFNRNNEENKEIKKNKENKIYDDNDESDLLNPARFPLEHFIYSYFLRTNSFYNMNYLINFNLEFNYNYGSFNNNKFFFRDSVILEKLFKKGLKKFPLTTNYVTLHNKFFLYN